MSGFSIIVAGAGVHLRSGLSRAGGAGVLASELGMRQIQERCPMTKLNCVSLECTKYMSTQSYKYKYMFKRSVRIHPVLLLALVFSQYSPLFLGRTRCTILYIYVHCTIESF